MRCHNRQNAVAGEAALLDKAVQAVDQGSGEVDVDDVGKVCLQGTACCALWHCTTSVSILTTCTAVWHTLIALRRLLDPSMVTDGVSSGHLARFFFSAAGVGPLWRHGKQSRSASALSPPSPQRHGHHSQRPVQDDRASRHGFEEHGYKRTKPQRRVHR